MATEVSGSEDVEMDDADAVEDEELFPSLIIPVTSSNKSSNLFVEIFAEELPEIASSTILQVLKDEDAELNTWADAALLYMQQRQSRESSTILQAACDLDTGNNRDQKVRILASAGIALLTEAQQSQSTAPGGIKRPGGDPKDELRSMADNRFTHASKVDTLFPMTWIGRGMLNLSAARLDQARFFFETTLKQCGPVLPALLGMAAVLYGEKDYKGAQEMYAKAMRLYPVKSGSSTRVGFGLACYRLGQVDRAKAAMSRALSMDSENVEAMVGAAVLAMASLDETSQDFGSQAEKAIKMISMANLLDHSNAMVQNHLANHYFWKWTPVAGMVEVTQGSKVVKCSQNVPLDAGELVRIGMSFETYVTEDTGDDDDDNATFRIRDAWKDPSTSGLKLWKKDYDRVVALAKGAYSSTSVKEIQAESLFFLARVYHVREDFDNAQKFYEKSCKLAPNLSPARYGLAQVLIMQEKYADAAAHLKLVIGTSARATDALALLGLLEVREGKNIQDGLLHIRKAIDLDPLNPDLVVLEALALQQHESSYTKALDRYQKAVQLMGRRGKKVPYEIYTNIGVLCHETKKFDKALEMYKQSFKALDEDETAQEVSLDSKEIEGGAIVLNDNKLFFGYADTELMVEVTKAAAVPVPPPPATTTTEKPSDGDNPQDSAEQDKSTEDGDEKTNPEDKPSQNDKKDDAADKKDDATEKDKEGEADKPVNQQKRRALKQRIGESFESEIVKIESSDGRVLLTIKGVFDEKENAETSFKLFVKRGNKRLDKPEAISIAFNLARLHEAVGRTLAAIEIHKAIVKRNPSYVNSYLRLACIARDCGCLTECAEWLKIAATTAPGNPEVLTLIGNLHLSLCDWQPAQNVFDGLLAKKVPNVEAYAMLSLGNIYFNNLDSPKRYAKHLQYASDYYKRILSKDSSNAYAANGLGAVLAEKGELFKAKEVFNRVREVQENIADALLNLGHIYLAQKKHPEALQMYRNYMKRTEDGSTDVTSKSRLDDLADVELYIAFCYFDWARHTELFNNAKAAPADERYQKAMEHLERALSWGPKKEIILRYNLCMTRLQAGNCVLQKLTRNIRRTAKEVEMALNGLEESLATVESLIEDKTNGQKVPVPTSVLNDFVVHCKANIASAKSHLADERKREEEANTERELQRLAAEAARKEEDLRRELQKEEERRKQEEMDRKAEARMRHADQLRADWQHQEVVKKAAQAKKARTAKPQDDDFIVDDPPEDAPAASGLFDDSEDESEDEGEKKAKGDSEGAEGKTENATQADLFGDSDDDEESDEELLGKSDKGKGKDKKEKSDKEKDSGDKKTTGSALFGNSDDESSGDELLASASKDKEDKPAPKPNELFGESDDDDDEAGESSKTAKRPASGDEEDNDQPKKKRKVDDEDDD
ncbi:associated protein CTR9 homolog [Seminavis robusta]|uniref:Associated protein CTR9 homolog n=1 Tax=Seminavis robusta TaxID=568900 RepID=A0A9N8HE00_9STRA|nr:associated protein CTR9 homolog [Seminavis robusta]|eukprot:Sro383_g131310.1 associated protein CTR9 homolog (1401) ;mRNA; f:31224-35678